MSLGTPQEEIKKATECQSRTKDLRDRMEKDFELKRGQLFNIPKKEGEWESYTTNQAKVYGNKIVNGLAVAGRHIWIPLADENIKERDRLSDTERMAIASIRLADTLFEAEPESPSLQAQMSFQAAIRGFLVLRCYLYEEDDALVPDIAVWDAFNTYWISGGRKGLLWVCYKRFANKDQLEDEYGKKLKEKADDKGRVVVWNMYDREEEGVCLGKGEEWLKKESHGIGHVPVVILAAGSTPLIQSDKHTDTIKDVGPSIYENNRDIYEVKSRLRSYRLTQAGMAAKAPIVIEFDSSQGNAPELPRDAYTKGKVIYLDKAKGQSYQDFIKQDITRGEMFLDDAIDAESSMGGLSPISHGFINRDLPAAGISMLLHADLATIKPPLELMERAFQWLAHEITAQYVEGGFSETELEGIDNKNRRFQIKVKPENIDPKWHFQCKLTPDTPQDELQNMDLAIRGVESELMAPRTAQDKYLHIEDTDAEDSLIMKAKARKIPAVMLRQMAASLLKDDPKDEDGLAAAVMAEIQTIEGGPGGGNGAGGDGAGRIQGNPQGIDPKLYAEILQRAGGAQGNLPPEQQENVRLARQGLVRGT